LSQLTGETFLGARESKRGSSPCRGEDPSTGARLDPVFVESTAEEVDAACRAATLRFARPVCRQDFPDAALPEELRDANPRGIWRLVEGRLTREPA
jgi:hypothetical protein